MLRWLSVVCALSLLAGCGDPLRTVPKIGEVELSDRSESATAVALPETAEDTRPLFERLLRRADVAEEASGSMESDKAEVNEAPAAPDAPKRFKLFGLLASKEAAAAQDDSALSGLGEAGKIAPEGPAQAEVVDASFTPEEALPRAPRGGFFSRFKPARPVSVTGPDTQEIAPGTALAFGEIARVCALDKADMGREMERAGSYRLYDSAVGSTEPRPLYITGFADGCPRQVTGALALFGTATSHEAMRYGKPFEGKPYSETDTAYENVKRAVCGAGRGKPCGAAMGQLEKNTAFVTVYDQFVGAARWHNVLLHDGTVRAME